MRKQKNLKSKTKSKVSKKESQPQQDIPGKKKKLLQQTPIEKKKHTRGIKKKAEKSQKGSKKIESLKAQLEDLRKTVMDNFYSKNTYKNTDNYKKMLVQVTNIKREKKLKDIIQVDENQQSYRKKLKEWIFLCQNQVSKKKRQQIRKQAKKTSKRKHVTEVNRICQEIKGVANNLKEFYFQIIDDQDIFLSVFKFGVNEEQIFRKMMIESTFNYLIHLHLSKMEKQTQEQTGKQAQQSQMQQMKQKKVFWQELGIHVQELTQLSIQPSIVEEDMNVSRPAINQVLQKIKSSWYLRQLYSRYFVWLSQKGKIKKGQYGQEKIRQKLENLSIHFYDYAWDNLNGISQIRDPYLIFVNLFRFALQSQGFKQNPNNQQIKNTTEQYEGYLKSYLIIVLLHQIAHTLYRSLQAIGNQEQSNPDNPNVKDGGDLFQDFAFGGKVLYYLYDDYKNMEILLNQKQVFKIRDQSIFPAMIQQQHENKTVEQQILQSSNQEFQRYIKQGTQSLLDLEKENNQQLELLRGPQMVPQQELQQRKPTKFQIQPVVSLSKDTREYKKAFRFLQSLGKRSNLSYDADRQKAQNERRPLPQKCRISQAVEDQHMLSTLTPRHFMAYQRPILDKK